MKIFLLQESSLFDINYGYNNLMQCIKTWDRGEKEWNANLVIAFRKQVRILSF